MGMYNCSIPHMDFTSISYGLISSNPLGSDQILQQSFSFLPLQGIGMTGVRNWQKRNGWGTEEMCVQDNHYDTLYSAYLKSNESCTT